ncbi:24befc88-fdb3-4514-be56-3ff3531d2e97-CDS [Sclerotinia trifoliorum]|uniref:24befc88-fdb3-4514-be56-3ff3531d2e97-CDS n=1 Tax=Sclerotinia trifoliorum TaxID=28548 RepID=A0A8H2W280_9HELO|nr:24befc88-fdb3-4514-be56-3ff3531d2e97-CDS [Sclerotinia trifoliorum]
MTTGKHISQEQMLHNFRWQEKTIRLQFAQCLIQSLKFPTLKEREETISDVYRGTFRWLFDETNGSRPWTSFVQWLQHSSGIYWINGKAASGKSTLMRFICSHNTTKELLQQWSAPLPLVMAKFYFWNSGTIEQRSQHGLLRALLAEILGHLPDLLPVCFPTRWARIYNDLVKPFAEASYNNQPTEMDHWGINELEAAMRILISQDMQSFKLCLFVDGLDEYEGQPSTIAKYFIMLAQVPWLKICLSSRPLLEFDDSFGSRPSLRLQDLTRTDIDHFVKSTLQNNVNYQHLCVKQPVQASSLIGKIISRAGGVFLWVKLVLQEIERGLANRDTLQDLQERIEIIPLDLEELFSSMLDNIDPFYIKKSALIFLIVRAAHIRVRSVRTLDTFTLSFALDYWTSRAEDTTFNLQELQMRNIKIRDHLKVRCAGLLEIGPGYSPGFEYLGYRVVYLHRSVREYLERPEICSKLFKHVSEMDFEPYTPLMCSYVRELEFSEARKKILNGRSTLSLFMATVLHYAHEADTAGSDTYIEPLETFATLTHTSRLESTTWTPKKFSSFLHIAVNWDLCAYIKLSLNRLAPKIRASIVYILLPYALAATDEYYIQGMEQRENSEYLRDRIPPSPRIVQLLLVYRAQPNRKMKDFSAICEWTAFEIAIRNVCAILPRLDDRNDFSQQYSNEEKSSVGNHLEIVKVMLDYGADPNTYLNYGGRAIMPRKLLTETMRKHWRSKESDVDQMFEKKGGKLELSMIRKLMITG